MGDLTSQAKPGGSMPLASAPLAPLRGNPLHGLFGDRLERRPDRPPVLPRSFV